ncbi:hypothetical protein C0J52_21482 [Blattella germanica]|nr:hypothetical protein C0J52_21482 [Blattella germanica]
MVNLPAEVSEDIRREAFKSLAKVDPPKRNISVSEHHALKALRENTNDKGNAAEVMSSANYHEKITSLLEDEACRPLSITQQYLHMCFAAYHYRKSSEVFRSKKLLKGSGITVREDLTKRRHSLLKMAITKFGLQNVWTVDGNIIVKDGDNKRRITRETDL